MNPLLPIAVLSAIIYPLWNLLWWFLPVYKGWRKGTKEAVESEAKLRFFNFSKNNRELSLTIENTNFQQEKKFSILLYLNGTFIKVLETDKELIK